MAEGPEVDVRARGNAARCPYCRADVRAGEATWTCPGCQAQQHVECRREAGGDCLACRAPAKAASRDDASKHPRAAGLQPLLHALGEGYSIQSGILVMAAILGGLKGGRPGLVFFAAAAVSGAIVSGARGSPNAVALFLLHLLSNLPLMIVCFVAIDALDVPGGGRSLEMCGIGLTLAAASAVIGALLRRR